MALRHGRRRRETFFKVQNWNGAFSTWMDARKKTFDTFEEAKEFADKAKDKDKVRIVRFQNGAFIEVS